MDAAATLQAQVAIANSSAPERPRATADSAEARRAAEAFEAMFLAQMMAPMFAGISTDGPFGGGSGESVYRSLLIEEYGRVMARTGGVGIADTVYAEILKLQDVGDGA